MAGMEKWKPEIAPRHRVGCSLMGKVEGLQRIMENAAAGYNERVLRARSNYYLMQGYSYQMPLIWENEIRQAPFVRRNNQSPIPLVHLDECPEPPAYMPNESLGVVCYGTTYHRQPYRSAFHSFVAIPERVAELASRWPLRPSLSYRLV